MLKIRDDYEKIYSKIKAEVSAYLTENKGLKSLVMGLSGGVDSALTCALAHEIIKDHPHVKLIGRSIPIESNSDHEIMRAEKVGRAFCDDFETVDLTETYKGLYSGLISGSSRDKDQSVSEKIRRGNIKARLRMVYLFDQAHLHRGMVLSTDNYTELLLGFWTLHGDVGNYGFLQYLWKTEVYGLAGFLAEGYLKEGREDRAEALKLCIDAVPTDGLGITGSDFDQIGVTSYEQADIMLLEYLQGDDKNESHPLIVRHKASEFKRNDPRFIYREKLF